MASTPPKVSVGVPVYNGEDFLAETLDCLLDQTFPDFELVISDNASTDRTEEICRKYAEDDPRIRYVRNGRNIGITRNFNQLFFLARGEYFKWAAHDDLVSRDYLQRCVAVLDADPSVVLVSPRVRLIDDEGHPLHFDKERNLYVSPHGETVPPIPFLSDAGYSPVPRHRFADVALHLKGGLEIAYVHGLMRSEALARTTLLEPYIGSDKIMVAQLSLLGMVREIPEELFSWRIHPRHSGRKKPSLATRDLDPNRGSVPAYPSLQQLRGYFRSITRSPLPPRDKVLCTGTLARKVGQALRLRSRHLTSPSR